jgi:predicted RNase H-like nuclease (RuvC/YqgF family)
MNKPKVTHTTLPSIEVIENLKFNIEVRDKRIRDLEKYLEYKTRRVDELETRIKAMTSPKIIDELEEYCQITYGVETVETETD